MISPAGHSEDYPDQFIWIFPIGCFHINVSAAFLINPGVINLH